MVDNRIIINKTKGLNYTKYLFLLFAFSMPLWQKLSTIILVCLACVSIVKIKRASFNRRYLAMFGLYFVYIISELIHQPPKYSVFEMKLPLLILPIIFMCNSFTKKTINESLRLYIYGIVTACAFCYFNALYASISFANGFEFNSQLAVSMNNSFLDSSMKGGNYFFGNNFSIFHQSVYFSLLINIAVAVLLFTDIFLVKFKYFLLLLLGLLIFQVSNRVNIAVYFILIFVGLLVKIKNKKKKYLALGFSLIICFVIMISNPRVKIVIDKLTNIEYFVDREANDSMGTRFLIWHSSLNIVEENFFIGVGPSKTYNELKKNYKQKRYVIPFRNRLNAHNAYLQIFIECGVFGLLVMLIIFALFIKHQNQNKLLNILILLIFSLNFLFESMFNRYSGLVSFSFFYCAFTYVKSNRNSNHSPKNRTVI